MSQLVQLYRCGACDYRQLVPHGTPAPRHCTAPMRWVRTQTYTPPPPRFGQAPALDFAPSRDREIPLQDAHGAQVKVESLHQIRQIERESQRRAADGEGQEVRFRMYSQDRSNRHTNTFGEAPARGPSRAWLRQQEARTGRPFREALIDATQAGELGPGTAEALTSALPETP